MKDNQKKIKSILFKYELKGQGVVNFDGKEQKWILKNLGFKEYVNSNDNNNYAKKTFFVNTEGKNEFLLKISGVCQKHEMFQDERVKQNNKITHDRDLNLMYLSSPLKIIGGYMQTEKGELGLRRKSCILINDAIQSSKGISAMEFFAKSGFKKKNKVETDLLSLLHVLFQEA